jgi:ADP-heptose:LPS heptosyltransferase
MAGILKNHFPAVHICFLGTSYTKPVLSSCRYVDSVVEWDILSGLPNRERTDHLRRLNADAIIHVFQDPEIIRLADRAGIPLRIATTHRWLPWLFCNRMVWFSRRRSDLHEAQLNLKLLKPFGITNILTRDEIPDYYGLTPEKKTEERSTGPHSGRSEKQDEKFRLILHPKSKGSAREWGLENFSRLIQLLPAERYEIFITGTKAEGEMIASFLDTYRHRVTDMTGKMDLNGLMRFIAGCDGMVAASTGPLHLAAALGKIAIGLYAPMRPIYPKRWAPLGRFAGYLALDKKCSDCRRSFDCHCMKSISAESVFEKLRELEVKFSHSREP